MIKFERPDAIIEAVSDEASPSSCLEFRRPPISSQLKSERNRCVKAAMSSELIAMGLSPEAIARILNLDQE